MRLLSRTRTSVLTLALGMGTALGACTPQYKPPVLAAPSGETMAVGPAKVHRTAPPDRLIGIDATGKPAIPRIAEGAPGGVTSNDWWSSLIYAQDASSVESLPLYAHPLVLQTHAGGIGVSYPNQPKIQPREYMYRHDEDFVVGLEGFSASQLKVLGHSDFDVHVELGDGSSNLQATFGHGLPFLQIEKNGSAGAVIRFTSGKNAEIRSNEGGVAVFGMGGRVYAAFAPQGSWEKTADGLRSDLGGSSFFSVAALPNDDQKTVLAFADHAFAFIKRTRVSWDAQGGVVTTNYEVETELVAPCGVEAGEEAPCSRTSDALLALYPHQWANSQNSMLEELTFASPRGPMKLVPASEFQTRLTVEGLLPNPPVPEDEESKVGAWMKKDLSGDLFPLGLGENPDYDAYWDGKSLGRISTLAHIAEAIGKTSVREHLVEELKERLRTWFDGEAPRFFYYDERWRSLMAFPDSYGSASHLNDHHFHYGYFIHAAATVARFDAAWAKRYQPMVELMIRDVATIDENDPLFPRLRHMDLYAGHSWANGPAQFFEGNNEESSSEDINFSYAVALWGAMMENQAFEQLGLYLYATQVSAVEEYWFDVENRVFPEEFKHPTVAMVWGAGGKYDTWFDQDPGIIHGINFLPFTGGSYYLGRHPEYVKKNFQTILDRSYGKITTWRDPILMFAALGDPEQAWRHYKSDRLFHPEFGASNAMTRLFIASLRHFGLPVFSDSPPSPYAISFKKDGRATRVAFDPKKKRMTQRVK